MSLKRPPPLRPLLQPPVISTPPPKAPAQEAANLIARWFDARVGRTHEALPEVLEAVGCVRGASDAEIEIL